MCLPYILGEVPLGPSPWWNFWSSDHSGPEFGLQGQSMAHSLRCARYWQPLQDWDTGPGGWGLCRKASLIKARPDLSHPPATCLKYFLPAFHNTWWEILLFSFFCIDLLVDTLLLITFILKFYIWSLNDEAGKVVSLSWCDFLEPQFEWSCKIPVNRCLVLIGTTSTYRHQNI